MCQIHYSMWWNSIMIGVTLMVVLSKAWDNKKKNKVSSFWNQDDGYKLANLCKLLITTTLATT